VDSQLPLSLRFHPKGVAWTHNSFLALHFHPFPRCTTCKGSLFCRESVNRSVNGFTIRLKRLKPWAPDFGGHQIFRSKVDFQHFCKQLYFCFGSTHVFYNAASKRSVWNRGFQTFSSDGHISYKLLHNSARVGHLT